MITPSTPDHTLDIPNKKWNGMVRSWRVALHRYDPVDLQQSFAAAQQAAVAERENSSKSHTDSEMLTVKEKEIANSGLVNLVHVNSIYKYGGPDTKYREKCEPRSDLQRKFS